MAARPETICMQRELNYWKSTLARECGIIKHRTKFEAEVLGKKYIS